MHSRFQNLKARAITLREQGRSIGDIEGELGIPRSTLSGWFKNVRLTPAQRKALEVRWKEGLAKARVEAVKWHNAGKAGRLAEAKKEAEGTLSRLDTGRDALELALAFLYLGEGAKTNQTAVGNSDPRIVRFFIAAVRTLYDVPLEKIRCELHLRADQDPQKMLRYWSRELELPIANFASISIDKRTAGRPTYPHYKGVCLARCGQVAIQRKLVYIASGFCERVASE